VQDEVGVSGQPSVDELDQLWRRPNSYESTCMSDPRRTRTWLPLDGYLAPGVKARIVVRPMSEVGSLERRVLLVAGSALTHNRGSARWLRLS
jgi:hypothetical protein